MRVSRKRRSNLITNIFAGIVIFGIILLCFVAANKVIHMIHSEPADVSDRKLTQNTEFESNENFKEISQEEKLSIIRKSSKYPKELKELAETSNELIDYVYNYPEEHNKNHEIDLSGEIDFEDVPLLLQWDKRWGYKTYGSGLIGYTGCGPVSLSMAAIYLRGDTEFTPDKVADLAEIYGYCVPGNGTSWTLISEGSSLLDLSAKELPLEESIMKSELDKGLPIIIVVGEGDFTVNGHYMVIRDYNDEGFIINDPNSPEKSSKVWPYDRLSPQIRNLWAMSLDR